LRNKAFTSFLAKSSLIIQALKPADHSWKRDVSVLELIFEVLIPWRCSTRCVPKLDKVTIADHSKCRRLGATLTAVWKQPVDASLVICPMPRHAFGPPMMAFRFRLTHGLNLVCVGANIRFDRFDINLKQVRGITPPKTPKKR
jgi:hypothetical protein